MHGCVVFFVISFMLATPAAAGHYHSDNLANIFSIDPHSIGAPDGEMPPGATNVSYLLTLYAPPKDLPPGFLSIPVQAAPICVAFNNHLGTVPRFSLLDIGVLLTSENITQLRSIVVSPTPLEHEDDDHNLEHPSLHVVTAADLTVVVAKTAPMLFSFVHSLVVGGVPGFVDATPPLRPTTSWLSLPASVRTNKRIVWVDTNNDVVGRLREDPLAVAFVSPTYSADPHLNCAPLRLQLSSNQNISDRINDDEEVLVLPVLDASHAPWLSVNQSGLQVSRLAGTTTYPLLGALLLNINVTASCSGSKTVRDHVIRDRRDGDAIENIIMMFSTTLMDSALRARLDQFGLMSFDAITTMDVMHRTSGVVCSGSTSIPAVGDTARVEAILSLAYEAASGDQTFVDFDVDSSSEWNTSSVVAAVASAAQSDKPFGPLLGVTSTPLMPADARGAVVALPFAAYAVSVLVNIPGALTNVVLSRCTLIRIYSGDVVYWNDPSIQAWNYLTVLPHARIRIGVVPSLRDANYAFTVGLAAMLPTCLDAYPNETITNASAFVPSTEWQLPIGERLASVTALLQYLRDTPYSMIFVPEFDLLRVPFHSHQDVPRMHVALLHRLTMLQIRSSDSFLQQQLPTSVKMNTQTRTVEMNITSPTVYPFIGLMYMVLHTRRSGRCDIFRRAVGFLRWTMTSIEAATAMTAYHFLPLPSALTATDVAWLESILQCDGRALFPGPPDATHQAWFAILLVIIILLTVICGVIIFRVFFLRRRERDVTCAPTASPFGILFTDIQSSTKLWAQLPAVMPHALRVHNDVIRQVIAKHRAYEVKTIGDAFMIAVPSAHTALRVALDIQEALQDAHWGQSEDGTSNAEVIAAAYHHIAMTTLDPTMDRQPSLLSIEAARGAGVVASGVSSAQSLGIVISSPTTVSISNVLRAPPVNLGGGGSSLVRGLKVRIGVHFGEGDVRFDEVTKGYDYFGTVVNTASRIESAGHGGQILVSEAVMDEVGPLSAFDGGVGGGGGGEPSEVNAALSPTTTISSRRSAGRSQKQQQQGRWVSKWLGSYCFRGLEESPPLVVYQVLPMRFRHRIFPSLRDIVPKDPRAAVRATPTSDTPAARSARIPSHGGGDHHHLHNPNGGSNGSFSGPIVALSVHSNTNSMLGLGSPTGQPVLMTSPPPPPPPSDPAPAEMTAVRPKPIFLLPM